jgi:F-type H+-transporting ATPase subunit a
MDVGFEFLQQALIMTMALAPIVSLAVAQLNGLPEAYSTFFGAVWGCVNLFLITELVKSLLLPGARNYTKIVFCLAAKFPLLYLGGYAVLAYTDWPPIYSLLGFSLIFVAFLIKGARLIPLQHSLFLLCISLYFPLHGSLTSEVPEVPNIFTFIHKGTQHSFAYFLHQWDAVIFSIFLAILIALVFVWGARRRDDVPTTRLQNFLELIVESMRKFSNEILGPEGDKYVPFLGTLFIYILMMNWMVLFPFMKAPSSSLSITAALAICVFVLVQFLSIRNFGFFGYLYHMAGSPKGALGWAMVPLMFPIELLTQLSRPLTLAFRLFGNVIGEDILIGAFALFGVALFANSPVGIPLQMPFMLFAMMTGLMQALVFTLLTAIYILLSSPDHNEDEYH